MKKNKEIKNEYINEYIPSASENKVKFLKFLNK